MRIGVKGRLLAAGLLTLLTSCGPTNLLVQKLPYLSPTTIAIKGHTDGPVWLYSRPILMIKQIGSQPQRLKGKIVSVTDSGIVFNPGREGPFYDPDTTFYRSDAILSFVDKKGHLIFGKWPNTGRLLGEVEIKVKSYPDRKHYYAFRTNFHDTFFYPLPPGKYIITSIILFSRGRDMYVTTNPINKFFVIKPNCINYFGDLYLYTTGERGAIHLDVPMKMKRDVTKETAYVLGGLSAVGMYTAQKDRSSILDSLDLQIAYHDSLNVPKYRKVNIAKLQTIPSK